MIFNYRPLHNAAQLKLIQMPTALVTGASSGIGLELAKIFARNRTDLVLVARSEDKLNDLAHELRQKFSVQVKVVAADLADMHQVENLYNVLQLENVFIDYLVNNAGFGEYGMFHETDWNKEAKMIDLNVKSLTYMTKLFVREMVKRKTGKILNVASTASFQPGPTMAVYYATKAYVLSFSEAISNEFREYNITVTALCPGATRSGFQKVAGVEEIKLVKGKKLPSSASVADFGYRAMMKGKVVAVPGFLNKLMVTGVRLSPRALVRTIVRNMQEKAG